MYVKVVERDKCDIQKLIFCRKQMHKFTIKYFFRFIIARLNGYACCVGETLGEFYFHLEFHFYIEEKTVS